VLDPSLIEPEQHYWAIKTTPDAIVEVVYVSTVFGKEREYWTVARLGNEAHSMLEEFDFLEMVSRPTARG
jgi:hypothetical protein